MNICILAAGAGGMYCGSCLRDSALAMALRRRGHDVTLIPLYTPLRTDAPAETAPVFYGGVNVYLQYASRLFRRTPRVIDWLFDRPWLLNLAGRFGAQTSPAKIGPFILSILQGDQGPQLKELRRLLQFMREHARPQVVSLPNLMFIGMARMIRDELDVPVVCELTGEDIFLHAMAEPHRSRAMELIRQRSADVARFVATSRYYARVMAEELAIGPERIEVVHCGVGPEYLGAGSPVEPHPPTVGYFARICPEKGLDRLIEAFALLKRMPGMEDVRLRAAGYLGAANRRWFAALQKRVDRLGLADCFSYGGELDLAGKLAFLDSVDVLSVPGSYPEPKGLYALEAMARGLPAVLPNHGAFPELIELTGGGLLVPPGDAHALASALAGLLADADRRRQIGENARKAVASAFTDEHMAANMLAVYQSLLCQSIQA